MIYDLVYGDETFDIVDYRLPRQGDLYIVGRHVQTALADHGYDRDRDRLIVKLRNPYLDEADYASVVTDDPEPLSTTINVVIDVDTSKLERILEAAKS